MFRVTFNMASSNTFRLDRAKILSSVKWKNMDKNSIEQIFNDTFVVNVILKHANLVSFRVIFMITVIITLTAYSVSPVQGRRN